MESWLSFARELAVVPRYPSRGGACWTVEATLLRAGRFLEEASEQQTNGQKLKSDNWLNLESQVKVNR